MKLIVFGYKTHGKDTVCEYLSELYGVSYAASSWYACTHFLFDQIKDQFGYATHEECFADRVNHRPLWYNAIRDYNQGDRARMGKEIFMENDIYCGIRDREEFEALRAGKVFDLAVWVDASERLPPESTNSMNLSIMDADLVINNNKSKEDLYAELDTLALKMNWACR